MCKLVPLFSCTTFEVPFRVVSPLEALKLSGLESHWKRTNAQDAEYLPDNLVRDMCGNSFHPALVCSALGKNSTLQQWIQGGEVNNLGDRTSMVASKSEAHAIYGDLVSKVASKFAKEHPNKPLPDNRTLPDLPEFNPDLGDECMPCIAERQLPVNRKLKLPKNSDWHNIGATLLPESSRVTNVLPSRLPNLLGSSKACELGFMSLSTFTT